LNKELSYFYFTKKLKYNAADHNQARRKRQGDMESSTWNRALPMGYLRISRKGDPFFILVK
jgi:hypothetical protein